MSDAGPETPHPRPLPYRPKPTADSADTGPRHGADNHHDFRPFLRIGGKVTGALLSFVLLLAAGYGWYNFAQLNNNAHTIAVAGLGAPTPTGSQSGTSAAPVVDGTAQNILIVGLDSRVGLTQKQKQFLKVGNADTLSTDTLMLVHVPADGSRATLISIPRDSWVQIPGGHPDAKINAAYADGYANSGAQGAAAQQAAGAGTLVATVKKLTGVTIDHYVQVGFEGFVNIVRAIGTIPVDLCQSVDDTHAHNVAIGSDGGSGFKMSAGHHNLTPQQALEFVRQRHNIPGPVPDDLGRELRQRYFLSAAFKRILSANVLLNPFKLHSLINAVDGAFTFDNNNFDLTKFAEQMVNLTADNIKGESIPNEGDFTAPDGSDAIKVDPATVQAAVQQAFYGAPSGGHHKHHKKQSKPTTADQGCVY